MDDNTRVLACRIDADLRLRMKEYIAKEGITVKEYVTGLIKENLEKNAVKAKQEEKKTEEKDKTQGEQENKKEQPIKDKKEEEIEIKQPMIENKKEEVKDNKKNEEKKETKSEQFHFFL